MRRRRWHFLMSPLEHISIRYLDDVYRGRLMPGGRVLVWGVLASAFMLAGGLSAPLVSCFAFCISALVAAFFVGLFFRPRVTMQRRLGVFPSSGERFSYTVEVRNAGRTTLRNLTVEERGLPFEVRPSGEAPMIDTLLPGESASVTLSLQCNRRGAYELRKLQAASSFPSGLIKCATRNKDSMRLLVYPRLTPLESLEVPVGRNYQPGGISVASEVGESTEFFGTRDWRDGDRVRDVHWPSYARTGKLVVKEFQEEYFVRLAMVMDVQVRGFKQEALLEKSLSLAAGIADALARRDYIIDLFAAGADVFHFQAGRALAHFDNILQILACVDDGETLDLAGLKRALIPESPRLSAVIFLMMDWDAERAELVQQVKAQGVAVRVLCMRQGVTAPGLQPEEWVAVP